MSEECKREQLTIALQQENKKFRDYYFWLESALPPQFFDEIGQANAMLVVHNLMKFDLQDYVASIHLKHMSVLIYLDTPQADLQILKEFSTRAISSYQTFVSQFPPPFLNITTNLRIIVAHFFNEDRSAITRLFPKKLQNELRDVVADRYPKISDEEFNAAVNGLSPSFLHSLSLERLAIAIAMYIRASTRDSCQYEVHYDEEWESKNSPSMRITLAWKNIPKHNFLYRIMRIINRYGIAVKQISGSHQNPYNTDSVCVLALDLHGINGKPVWEAANIMDFIKEIITVKYFASFDSADLLLVQKGIISGNMANLLRAMENFIHQSLVHIDSNIYTRERITEGLYRHPELVAMLCEAFKYKFDPDHHSLEKYRQLREKYLINVEKLDTGHEESDTRRKNILRQAMNFVHFTLKTNFYCPNYTSLSFRLDPKYLDEIPFDRTKKFPELPYAIFFIKGMHFFGFHIRFRDLARGGLRTVLPEHIERVIIERNSVFTECYNLAYTQQMKNKDIPEGGAKGIIFLKPYERLESETLIYLKELKGSKLDQIEIEKRLETFKQEQLKEHLYQAQRSFIESLIALVNCNPDGKLKSKYVIDYWTKPEYLYLGPDENMHDCMIQWIANYSKKSGYKSGSSFISGKPTTGINHKQYGVTSLGVNVYMTDILKYLEIDPTKDTFTVKMAGGPDGDVAGNQICNLAKYYPNTAKLIALTDISGTIYDPVGLDLNQLVTLFKEGKGIRFYPPEKLNPNGLLIDKMTKQYQTLTQQTLCWRKRADNTLEKEWISGSEVNSLLRSNIHQTKADIFIPAGGRPRTLNESNYKDFLTPMGAPTARAIIEGANLYITPGARIALEELGVLIVKDSSANKTGVICSSFEVLCGLTLGDDKFVEYKPTLIGEIRERLQECASLEARLLLSTHRETGEFLTVISEKISRGINQFTDQLLNYLDPMTLSDDPEDPMLKVFLSYCLPTLRKKFQKELIAEIPESHKKAIIACHVASKLVYSKGLSWSPTIIDILPMVLARDSL